MHPGYIQQYISASTNSAHHRTMFYTSWEHSPAAPLSHSHSEALLLRGSFGWAPRARVLFHPHSAAPRILSPPNPTSTGQHLAALGQLQEARKVIWAFLFCLHSIWKFLIQGYHDPRGASSSSQPQAVSLNLIGRGCGSSGGLVLTSAHSLHWKGKSYCSIRSLSFFQGQSSPLNEYFSVFASAFHCTQ